MDSKASGTAPRLEPRPRHHPPCGATTHHASWLRLALALGLAALAVPTAAAGLDLLERADRPFVAPGRDEALPEWPDFDSTSTLRWAGPQRAADIGDCEPLQWRLWTSDPHIEEVLCPDGPGALLRRVDGPAGERWRYGLEQNGPRARVVGRVGGGGLLLDTLWRINPTTGAASDLIASHPARRSLRATGPIAADYALIYVAEPASGSLARGAIVRLDRANAAQQVVATLPRRGLLSRWVARDLAVSADGRWLFVALEEDWRGPSRVALGVLDLRGGRWQAVEEHCAEGHCNQPRVVFEGGRLGFGFRDLRASRVALIRYRWKAD